MAADKKKKFDPEGVPYRRCVGMLILNDKGHAWAGHRIAEPDSEFTGIDLLWQLPQGGIDKGEEPLAAAWREILEETGMESLELLGEIPHWINYDLPPDLMGVAFKGKYRGQTQKWFAFRFHGDESEIRISPPPGGHKAEFDEWAWHPLDDLPGLIVAFKRKVYEEVIEAFRHLA